MTTSAEPTCVVVMGVSGAGKSTVARALADRLAWPLAEADEFHPPANIAKMSAGTPLTDADRAPWLAAIRDWITARAAAGESTVVTCSALKRTYRDVLREAGARVRFLHLDGTADVIGDRLRHRSGHFMPPSLLRSQFDALEPLRPDEDGAAVGVADPPELIAEHAVTRLDLPVGNPATP
ncbi:gluconate kinase (SKI family) [Saccharothrix carnea]|uniref:Gluconokinase n=1 Tax=Saccharothrix carnea TaxID=1280637 RepID=A0A2P8HZI5_SACCR|nr:gluconokinase [Saccharothrix carnea]PSL51638.1 gluconate kinase (SKI family) [Saccharothrix carnea]